MAGFAANGLQTEVHAVRVRKPLPQNVEVKESYTFPMRYAPWRLISEPGLARLNANFSRALREADPHNTVAYFWPAPPTSLLEDAKSRAILTVREMINTACALSGPILDDAYMRRGLPSTHPVSEAMIQGELEELALYDRFFASNPEVEISLKNVGIPASQILSTSFGWNPARFHGAVPADRVKSGVRVLFVGSLGIRKGVADLLDAWARSSIEGELALAGAVEPAIADMVGRHVAGGRVRHLGYVEDLGALYRSADIFAFPTYEEGGPQVTYEAAGCGLPIITTAMGAARLVETGETGVVVRAGDVQALSEALRSLASDPEMRARFGKKAKEHAVQFDYAIVGPKRAQLLIDAIRDHRNT